MYRYLQTYFKYIDVSVLVLYIELQILNFFCEGHSLMPRALVYLDYLAYILQLYQVTLTYFAQHL